MESKSVRIYYSLHVFRIQLMSESQTLPCQEMEEPYIKNSANKHFSLSSHPQYHKHMRNFKNKYRIGNVINNSSRFKVSPNLNTFALSYCSVMSFIMLDLLVKACRVHSHLFCRGHYFTINF